MPVTDRLAKLGETTSEGPVPKVLRTYAEFGRGRGGLLGAFQVLIGLVQLLLVVRLLPSQAWWSPAGLLPLYLGYFALRDPIWRRLYGTLGRVEVEKSLAQARFALWWSPAIMALSALLWWRAGVRPVAWPIPLAWLVVFWLPLLLRGRLPVDNLHYMFHSATAVSLLHQRRPDLLLVSGLLGLSLVPIALYGLYEHHKFGHVLEGWPRK